MNLPTGFLLLIGTILFARFFFKVDVIFVFLSILSALFLFSKVNLIFFFCQGHGVLGLTKFKIRGLTIGKVIYLIILAIPISYVLIVSFTFDLHFLNSTIQNLRYFSLSMAIAYVISLLLWHYYWYDKTYYCSAYELRIILQGRGYANNYIDTKIDNLSRQGLLNE